MTTLLLVEDNRLNRWFADGEDVTASYGSTGVHRETATRSSVRSAASRREDARQEAAGSLSGTDSGHRSVESVRTLIRCE